MPYVYQIDSEEITVPDDFERLSGHLNEYIKAMVSPEEDQTKKKEKQTIPLSEASKVSAKNLTNIINFLDVYKNSDSEAYEVDLEPKGEEKRINTLPAWAKEFFDTIEKDELFESMNASNFLIVRPFVRYSTLYIARKIEDMSVIEMRQYLNVEADFSKEEWDDLKKEPCWNELMRKEGLIPESEAVLANENQ